MSVSFGYHITYVADVAATLKFFTAAFGLQTKFLHPSGTYGELNTGSTTLAFAAHSLGEANLPLGYARVDQSEKPVGTEIALVTADIDATHSAAIALGAVELAPIKEKPWGQRVSYIREPTGGLLIELCTPIGA